MKEREKISSEAISMRLMIHTANEGIMVKIHCNETTVFGIFNMFL